MDGVNGSPARRGWCDWVSPVHEVRSSCGVARNLTLLGATSIACRTHYPSLWMTPRAGQASSLLNCFLPVTAADRAHYRRTAEAQASPPAVASSLGSGYQISPLSVLRVTLESHSPHCVCLSLDQDAGVRNGKHMCPPALGPSIRTRVSARAWAPNQQEKRKFSPRSTSISDCQT